MAQAKIIPRCVCEVGKKKLTAEVKSRVTTVGESWKFETESWCMILGHKSKWPPPKKNGNQDGSGIRSQATTRAVLIETSLTRPEETNERKVEYESRRNQVTIEFVLELKNKEPLKSLRHWTLEPLQGLKRESKKIGSWIDFRAALADPSDINHTRISPLKLTANVKGMMATVNGAWNRKKKEQKRPEKHTHTRRKKWKIKKKVNRETRTPPNKTDIRSRMATGTVRGSDGPNEISPPTTHGGSFFSFLFLFASQCETDTENGWKSVRL